MVGGIFFGVLTVLGGFGFLPHADGEPAARFSPEEQRIVSVLPIGFAANSCRTAGTPPAESVASLDCLNGSTQGRFSLFVGPDSMNRAFQHDLTKYGSGHPPPPCPGLDDSPANWHYAVTPDQTAGQIVCGIFEGTPAIEWTRNRQLLLLDVHSGADVNSLFQWWGRFGNATPVPFTR